MRNLLFFPFLLCLLSCGVRETSAPSMVTEDADTLLFVSEAEVDSNRFMVMLMNRDAAYPALVDSVIPSINDSTISLCVEAAFTGELLDTFVPANIAGDYVTDGVLRKGYECDANTGFMYADRDTVVIAPLDRRAEWTERAVSNNGMLFEQMMILHDGVDVYKGMPIRPAKPDIYRSACVLADGSFAVIQSEGNIPLGDFIASLIKLGVKDALYLDMGTGWNYGWYRTGMESAPVLLFEERTPFQTNWLIIKAVK